MEDMVDFGRLKVRPETSLAIDVAIAMHNGDVSRQCIGTGVKSDGSTCIHNISCPCPRCNAQFMAGVVGRVGA